MRQTTGRCCDMPKTKLTGKYSQPKTPPYDPLKALVLERVKAMHYRNEDLAKIIGKTPNTVYFRLKGSMRDWRYGELLDLCKASGVPIEDLRAAIRYQ